MAVIFHSSATTTTFPMLVTSNSRDPVWTYNSATANATIGGGSIKFELPPGCGEWTVSFLWDGVDWVQRLEQRRQALHEFHALRIRLLRDGYRGVPLKKVA